MLSLLFILFQFFFPCFFSGLVCGVHEPPTFGCCRRAFRSHDYKIFSCFDYDDFQFWSQKNSASKDGLSKKGENVRWKEVGGSGPSLLKYQNRPTPLKNPTLHTNYLQKNIRFLDSAGPQLAYATGLTAARWG